MIGLILDLLHVYSLVVLIYVVLLWLVSFRIVDGQNDIVRSVMAALGALTEPLLQHIRKRMPATGNVDFSPVVLLFVVWLIERIIIHLAY
ncbi:YggT family protein [Methylovirgula sp. 4M-Z18]|uniref:YggT family protein n=1 Tax=Methylovirgula sp. 4M-Z18 TaxID=2293567 RepID=UPI001314C8EB|nr:YggT family protein [Methylovirgula sp. 4M-Z18]